MDSKIQKLKTLQPTREVNYLPNRSALPKTEAVFLLNIRPGLLPTELPKPRIVIPIIVRDTQEHQAKPVKITHR